MYQTELAELIRNAINTSGPTQPVALPAKVALSPQEAIMSDTSHLFVIPDIFELAVDSSLRRNQIVSLTQNPFITVVYSANYVDLDTIDIGPWAESKVHLDYTEELATFLAKLTYSPLKISSIEIERVNDMMLDKRKFVGSITLGFTRQC